MIELTDLQSAETEAGSENAEDTEPPLIDLGETVSVVEEPLIENVPEAGAGSETAEDTEASLIDLGETVPVVEEPLIKNVSDTEVDSENTEPLSVNFVEEASVEEQPLIVAAPETEADSENVEIADEPQLIMEPLSDNFNNVEKSTGDDPMSLDTLKATFDISPNEDTAAFEPLLPADDDNDAHENTVEKQEENDSSVTFEVDDSQNEFDGGDDTLPDLVETDTIDYSKNAEDSELEIKSTEIVDLPFSINEENIENSGTDTSNEPSIISSEVFSQNVSEESNLEAPEEINDNIDDNSNQSRTVLKVIAKSDDAQEKAIIINSRQMSMLIKSQKKERGKLYDCGFFTDEAISNTNNLLCDDDESLEEMNARAEELYRNGDIKGAEELYNKMSNLANNKVLAKAA